MKRFVALLLPSSLGTVVILLAALLVIGFNAWSYIEYRQFFYDFLFGVGGLKTVLLQGPDHLTLLRRAVFGNGDSTYYVLLAMAGLLVGITTYAIIGGLVRAKHTAEDIMLELHQPEAIFHRSADEALLRLGVRAAAVVGWTIFFILWLNMLMPYATLLLEDAIDMVVHGGLTGYLLIVASYVLIVLGLHLHLIFLRLCVLRPRLFGNTPSA